MCIRDRPAAARQYLALLVFAIALSQGTGSVALQHVNYPVKVAFKSCKLVPTMAFSRYIVRDGKRYGVDDYAAALFMCVGLALLSAADLAAHAERDTQAAGLMLLVVAVCSDAVIPNLQEKLLRGLKLPLGSMVVLSNAGSFLVVLAFIAGQFVAYFNWTHLGAITAVKGAGVLQVIGLEGGLLMVAFLVVAAFMNFLVGSASAKWAFMAPIFVPMLMAVGYSPEVIQAAYRIGDSTTNIITPMMSYFGLILAFALRYDKKLGMGTLIATMIPYSIAYLLGWIVLFYGWVFVFDLPVGPGTPTFYP